MYECENGGWSGNGRMLHNYNQEGTDATGRHAGAGAMEPANMAGAVAEMDFKKIAVAGGLILLQGLLIGTAVYYGIRAGRRR